MQKVRCPQNLVGSLLPHHTWLCVTCPLKTVCTLLQASNYTLTYTPDETSRGIVDLGNPGFNVNLSVGNASYSDIYGRAGCFNVTLSPTGPGIRGQVLTYSSGQANTQG